MLWHKLIGFAILSLALTQLHFVQSNVADSGCRTNFSAVAGKCVFASKTYYTWYQGDRVCRSMGAGLLTLQNQSQLLPLSQWLNKTSPWITELWTSGNSLGINQNGAYYWQSTGELIRYHPWSPNQPQPADGDCLTFDAANWSNHGLSNYLLSVRGCILYAPIICEQQPQSNYNTTSRICLKQESFETAQVLV